jgi:hypothetical protein
MPSRKDLLSRYPAQKARQGEIVLKRPWQRVVFIAGLAGCVVLVLIAFFFPGVGR